jgi:hypothetical protein
MTTLLAAALALSLAAPTAPTAPAGTSKAPADPRAQAQPKPPDPKAAPKPPGDPKLQADPKLTVPPPQRLLAGMKGGAVRVAVLDPRATGEIPPRALAVFAQSLVPEVRKLEGVSAIGMAEIRDMLGFEYQRQMLGCAQDDACLAEIAGALGVDELVTTDLVLNGKTYALAVRRVDLRKARVAQSFDRTFEKRDGEELLAIVGPAVAGLYPDRTLRAGKTRGVEQAAISRLNPPPLPTWAFWATAGTAVVAFGAAGVSHVLATEAHNEYDRVVTSAQSTPTPASDLTTAADRVHARESTRNAFLAVGLGVGVAAGVEALFTDWRGDRRAPPRVAAGAWVAPEGGGLALSGRF